jgi:hypothetical protein
VPVTPGAVLDGDDIDLASDDTLVASQVQSPIALCPNPMFETRPSGHNYAAGGRLRCSDEEWTTLPPKKPKKKVVPTLQGRRKALIKPVESSSFPAAGNRSKDIHISVDIGSIARRYPKTQTLKRNVRN